MGFGGSSCIFSTPPPVRLANGQKTSASHRIWWNHVIELERTPAVCGNVFLVGPKMAELEWMIHLVHFCFGEVWKPKLDDGWPESEKDVFQAALRMVVVKDSRWIVGEFYMSYGKIWCEKVRLIKKRIFGKGHQMTCVLQPQRERGGRDRERERKREREREKEKARERERERKWEGGVERKHEEM